MKLITKEEFSDKVLDRMCGTEAEFIDAIVTICNELGIEVESCSVLLTDKLVMLLEEEAKDLNLLKNSGKRKEHSVFY